jgi:hypothetical protein
VNSGGGRVGRVPRWSYIFVGPEGPGGATLAARAPPALSAPASVLWPLIARLTAAFPAMTEPYANGLIRKRVESKRRRSRPLMRRRHFLAALRRRRLQSDLQKAECRLIREIPLAFAKLHQSRNRHPLTSSNRPCLKS